MNKGCIIRDNRPWLYYKLEVFTKFSKIPCYNFFNIGRAAIIQFSPEITGIINDDRTLWHILRHDFWIVVNRNQFFSTTKIHVEQLPKDF